MARLSHSRGLPQRYAPTLEILISVTDGPLVPRARHRYLPKADYATHMTSSLNSGALCSSVRRPAAWHQRAVPVQPTSGPCVSTASSVYDGVVDAEGVHRFDEKAALNPMVVPEVAVL